MVYSQIVFNSDTFMMPMKINPQWTGSFGELRATHFHGGIDFKTEEREGIPVFSVGDGKIVRITVSATSYGQAIYILHNNKIMSVYGHLQDFAPLIKTIVRQEQYKKKSFEIDLRLQQPISVKSGELIAYSGNTGSSGGPHLHFELRDKTGKILYNPQNFGFILYDNVFPKLYQLAIYPGDKYSLINNKNEALYLPLSCVDNCCDLIDNAEIKIKGTVYFGIEVLDYMPNSKNNYGLYQLSLSMDGKDIYSYKIDSFSLSESNDIAATIDYPYYTRTKKCIQQTKIMPNNSFSIYKKEPDHNGIYTFTEGIHLMRYEATDMAGNMTSLDFNITALPSYDLLSMDNSTINLCNNIFFDYTLLNKFSTSNVIVEMPPYTLYENIEFYYKTDSTSNVNTFSDIHFIYDNITPVKKNYILKIKTKNIPQKLINKACIASFDTALKPIKYEGGIYKNKFIEVNLRKFGIFAVVVDTIPPEIIAKDIIDNKINKETSVLYFNISDDFSGIKSYQAAIDNEWMLMEYDPKNKLLKGEVPDNLKNGEHNFILKIKDNKNNESIYKAIIIR